MRSLLIDIGNTSIHWRVNHSGSNLACPTFSFRHEKNWSLAISKLASTVSDANFEKILIASVSGQKNKAIIAQLLQSEFSIVPEYIHSESERDGVVNAYTNPEQLGVDRWLAVLAGYKIINKHDYAAALVVDAGTAMTIDAVLKYGEHLGGSIIAGWNLQQRTLLQNTQEIMASDGELLIFGKDTASAVAGGAVLALVGAIKQSLLALQTGLGIESKILLVLTGGDAELLEGELIDSVDIDIVSADNLVLDGLETYL